MNASVPVISLFVISFCYLIIFIDFVIARYITFIYWAAEGLFAVS